MLSGNDKEIKDGIANRCVKVKYAERSFIE